jgi:drug/metabolite transporter (DMT)-like permease
VLWTVEPILILVLARWLLRDRITGALAVTIVAAFAGVLLIVVQSGAGGAGSVLC